MTTSDPNKNLRTKYWRIRTKRTTYILAQSEDGTEELHDPKRKRVYRGASAQLPDDRLLFLFSEEDANGHDHLVTTPVQQKVEIDQFPEPRRLYLVRSI